MAAEVFRGLRPALLISLVLAVGTVGTVAAGPMDLTYNTTADVPQQTPSGSWPVPWSISGPGVVTFQGIQGGIQRAWEPFSLGQFVVTTPATDTTYTNVPFWVEFRDPDLHWVEPGSASSLPVQYDGVFSLVGRLNGTVRADGTSNLAAIIDQHYTSGVAPVPLDRIYKNSLPFSVGDVVVDMPRWPSRWIPLTAPIDGGLTDLTARVVPEPASALIFLAAAAGALGLRRLGAGRRGGNAG